MTLKRCPECGCNHIWMNSICSSCGLNTKKFLEQLIEETKGMDLDECKNHINDSISVEDDKEQISDDIISNINTMLKKEYFSQPIISCPACGKGISSESEKCIHCGYPLREKLIEQGILKKPRTPKPQPSTQPTNQVRCPKCGSTSIVPEKRGYDIMWGFLGSERIVYNVCQNCRYRWKPGKK